MVVICDGYFVFDDFGESFMFVDLSSIGFLFDVFLDFEIFGESWFFRDFVFEF